MVLHHQTETPQLTPPQAPEISDGTLQPLSNCNRIERLTLTNCQKLTDLSLTSMLQGNRSLLALDVTGLDSITDRSMFALAENAVRLQGLNITNCKKISDESLEAVAMSCRHLKRVSVSTGVVDQTWLTIAAQTQRLPAAD